MIHPDKVKALAIREARKFAEEIHLFYGHSVSNETVNCELDSHGIRLCRRLKEAGLSEAKIVLVRDAFAEAFEQRILELDANTSEPCEVLQ